jgi:polar amino acid transport system substrate-binding protein
MPPGLSPLLLAAAALAGTCVTASADNLPARVKQRGQLIAGVRYVVPAYVAGAKFRTPEAVDTALAEDIAKRLQASLTTLRTEPMSGARSLAANNADLLLAALPGAAPSLPSATIVATGFATGPMAIMRSDTDIKTWAQLRGRKVCVSEDGLYAGTIAAKYGAIEKRFKAPADSLLALRTGDCDAAVHGSMLLEELIKLPEWKKFSAKLPVGSRTSLSFIVPAADADAAAFLKQVTREWQATGYLQQLMSKVARSVAFEVYLDQDVPDCH